MSLSPGLLWLALNLALIIQCLSRNNTYIFQFYLPRKMSSHRPGGKLTLVGTWGCEAGQLPPSSGRGKEGGALPPLSTLFHDVVLN
jgi:hypothetical protein